MSTFSGLQTAAGALAAARRGMDVVGQNIANQTTPGYTRQRVETSAVAPVAPAGLFSAGAAPGGGVSVDGIARLGDALLDARVRDTLAASGFWSSRAVIATTAEAALAEPTDDGLAARLSDFWAGWQDVANTPDSGAARAVVVESASALVAHIAAGARSVGEQWQQVRSAAETTTAQINGAADRIAELNAEIRDALAAGRTANELSDRRSLLAQEVARLSGARADVELDGTMTLRLDGNALVSGDRARHLVLDSPVSIDAGQRMTLRWAETPDVPVFVTGGELAARIAALAPAEDGGTLARLSASYDAVATALVDAVNAQHRAGATSTGAAGGDVFEMTPGVSAALGLRVVVTADALALAASGAGALDTGNADAISQLGRGAGSPDALWADAIGGLGVSTAGDIQRARLAESAAVTAAAAQQSVAGVDGDEETINLLTHQTAYQAAARVMTAVDEALDVLINRTGLVGR